MCMRMQAKYHVLAMLVSEELERRTCSGDEFTAYDATLALRHAQPYIEIPHARVRVLVHQYMNTLVAAGEYETTLHDFGGKVAILYQPARVTSGHDIPFLPLLPLS